MPYCVVKHCKSTSSKLKYDTGLSFHRFPRDPILRNKWVKVLRKNREDDCWDPSTYCVICSTHFQESDLYETKTGLRRIHKNAIPTMNLFFPVEVITADVSLDLSYSTSSFHSTPTPDIKPTLSSLEQSTQTYTVSVTNDLSPNLNNFETDSDFDTPQQIHLKNQLRKEQLLRLNTKKKLKCMQQKVRRLKKRNASYKFILKDLEQKKIIDMDIHKKLTENVASTELFHSIYFALQSKVKADVLAATKSE